MLKKLFLLVCLAALGVLSYYVYMDYQKKKAKANEKKELVEAAPVVNVIDVVRQDMINERIYSGTTQAWSAYDVTPEVSAKLLKLNFDIGDSIHRNDLIAQIDDVEYIQAVRQAEAELQVQKAKYEETKALSKLRHSEFERQQQLLQSDATSLSDYETAESTMKVQDAETAQCEASILNCEAKLETARLRLGYTKIKANWESGSDTRYIGERYVDEGTLVSNGTPLLRIIEIDRMKAKIQIIERDFRFLKIGQIAEITTDAYPGKVFEGKISKISSELSENTRNVTAILEIDNKDIVLRPGMFIRVRIVLDSHKNAQTLPPNAILTKDGVRGIFVVNGANAQFVPVTTGIEKRDYVEITEPADIKAKVVTVGNHLLTDGKKVIVSELSRQQITEKLVKELNEKKIEEMSARVEKGQSKDMGKDEKKTENSDKTATSDSASK